MELFWIFLGAVALDYLIGDPIGWPHPVIYIGNLIKLLEKNLRSMEWVPLKVSGFVLTFLTLVTVIGTSTIILTIGNMIHPALGSFITLYLLFTSLATKCLHVETQKVYRALKAGDIQESRKLLSYLVGRETSMLSEAQILRADVETIAENTIDGVLAPIFYIIIGIFFGVPVQFALAYKAINTLDSMVGYTHAHYREIGFSSAKLDDLVNYLPARLGSLMMLLAGGLLGYDIKRGFQIWIRDRCNHKSPNCGYPEAVVAGLLKIQLGGTNTYFGEEIYKPTIGDANRPIEPEDILKTIRIMYGSQILFIVASLIVFL